MTDLGIAGPDKGKGGKFLFLPPGLQGHVPEGYYVFKSTNLRQLVRHARLSGERRSEAGRRRASSSSLRIYPLAQAAKPPATNFVNVSGKAFNTIHAMDFASSRK